jgi:hypothetical protein
VPETQQSDRHSCEEDKRPSIEAIGEMAVKSRENEVTRQRNLIQGDSAKEFQKAKNALLGTEEYRTGIEGKRQREVNGENLPLPQILQQER